MKIQMFRWVGSVAVISIVLGFSSNAGAAGVSSGPNILSGPTFTQATAAPLAGTLQVTTDVKSRVSVVVNDGTNTWQKDFFDLATNHSEVLLGFKPSRTNVIQVIVYDQFKNANDTAAPIPFVTGPLPANFPTSTVLQSQPSLMEPGYFLFIVENKSGSAFYITMMDNAGEVVWYTAAPKAFDDDVLQLADGNLFITDIRNEFIEMNMLGQIVRTWVPPTGVFLDIHGGVPTDHNTILSLTDVTNAIANFPSTTVSNAPLKTVNVFENQAIEMDYTTGAITNTWPFNTWLNRTRITYLSYDDGPTVSDNEHANAIIEDPSDTSIIVSVRDQNSVIKFSRAGQLKWILGDPANWGASFQQYLFTPTGTPFSWQYAEHAPMITPQNTLVMYDDGNFRTNPYWPAIADQSNYSRAVEFNLNTTNMTVSQVWDTTKADEDVLYTPAVGKAQWLPQQRNVLVTYGDVTFINGTHPSSHSVNATMVRVIEYTHDPVPQVAFDLSFFDYSNSSPAYLGYFMYRATLVPDLYTHPAVSVVGDYVVMNQNGTASVQFSADPNLSYVVQASTDMQNWTTVGNAQETGSNGSFEFEDFSAFLFPSRFYRVLTQTNGN